MDARGRIYEGISDEIPAEDKARLDGYLKGRSEATLISEERMAELNAELERLRAEVAKEAE